MDVFVMLKQDIITGISSLKHIAFILRFDRHVFLLTFFPEKSSILDTNFI